MPKPEPNEELSTLGEFGLIERLARRLRSASPSVRLGIGDDAAILALPEGAELVPTIDALIEEVHFRRDWSPAQDLGWKALAVNVSDLGAMGARPVGALITLAVPPKTPVKWIDALYSGLAHCAERYQCPIVGGDTVRSPDRIAISIAALGSVPAGKAVLRSGARKGDLICVSGTLGDSGAGLALLERADPKLLRKHPAPVRWHRRPEPPVLAGVALAESGLATAMLDLSDGLASDLRHLCKASRVGARIEAERLPISDSTRQAALAIGADPLEWAVYGGEDYQLLFTTAPERFPEVPPLLGPLGVTATIIGQVTTRGTSLISDGEPQALLPRGFAHFGERPGG